MLVVESKHGTRRYCYGGSGIFDVLKKVVNSSIAKRIAESVINGATQKLVETAIGRRTKRAATVVDNKETAKKKQRLNEDGSSTTTEQTDSLINGSGIVLD